MLYDRKTVLILSNKLNNTFIIKKINVFNYYLINYFKLVKFVMLKGNLFVILKAKYRRTPRIPPRNNSVQSVPSPTMLSCH